jgi:tRNA1Val (adenine37-N6)-methyltransferase
MAIFHFKHFSIDQTDCAMKIGTDALVLAAWVNTENQVHKILDIGTGTGVLSLMMAQKFPNSIIHAIEIDEKACNQANQNFNQNELGKNCKAFQADFLEHSFSSQYDLIISNPPYFSQSTKASSLERTLARHNDSLPLKDFLKKSKELLSEIGTLHLIIPFEESKILINYAQEIGLFPIHILNVYGKSTQLKRICIQFSKTAKEDIIQHELIIRDENGKYTKAYKAFTVDFHGVQLK